MARAQKLERAVDVADPFAAVKGVDVRGGGAIDLPAGVEAAGAASNLLAIVANGGYMPVSPGAAAVLGAHSPSAYSNSIQLPDPVLAPLTDIFALPPWVPFANVFSVGDVTCRHRLPFGGAFSTIGFLDEPVPFDGLPDW